MEDVSLATANGSSISKGQIQRSEVVDERSPLLVNGERRDTVGFTGRTSISKKEKWKKGCTVCSLWVAYLFCNAAYSIIGPFFPNEVSFNDLLLSFNINFILHFSRPRPKVQVR